MFKLPGPAIVYPFKSNGDDTEIELSIASMVQFYQGHLNVVVVGDKPKANLPPWAVHIPQDFAAEPLEDAIRKLDLITCLDVGNEFIYCHDDIFAVKPFQLSTLRDQVLYTHVRESKDWKPHNRWASAKKHSMELLKVHTAYDTATHMPRVFKKTEARDVLQRFTGEKLWDFQIAYDFIYPDGKRVPTTGNPLFCRVAKSPESKEDVAKLVGEKTFFNVNTSSYTKGVRDYVLDAISKKHDISLEYKEPPKTLAGAKIRLPIYYQCKNRGEDTGERLPCGTCAALTKDQPIFECSVHGYGILRRPKKQHKTLEAMNCVTCFSEGWGFQKKE